jgi:hypothetical protein
MQLSSASRMVYGEVSQAFLLLGLDAPDLEQSEEIANGPVPVSSGEHCVYCQEHCWNHGMPALYLSMDVAVSFHQQK